MTDRHIPESRIALNPVVIDDSKREVPDYSKIYAKRMMKSGGLTIPTISNIPKDVFTPRPIDEHALITRLMEWEMKEHIAAKKHHGFTKGLEHTSMEKAYGRVIRLIQEGRGVRK